MTAIKIVLLSILVVSCGPNVKLSSNKLENMDPLTNSQIANYQKSGVLIKGSSAQLQYSGAVYLVSQYSSKQAMDLINSMPTGSQVPVVFTGGVSGNQVVIETIKQQ